MITVLTTIGLDLVYGNHLSTERTPLAHHREIFQGLSKAKSNISRGAGGKDVVTLAVCPLWCLFKNTRGCLRLWIESGSGGLY